MVGLVVHEQISARICEQIVGVPVPQVAEQPGTRFVVVPVLQRVFSVKPLGVGTMHVVVLLLVILRNRLTLLTCTW